MKHAQPDLRVMVFRVAGQEYVIDVAPVQEIIRPTNVIPLRGAPGYVQGVIKRRGHVVPIIDVRPWLGLSSAPRTAATCVIIARLSIGPVGFVADSIPQLMWVKPQDFAVPSPIIAGADQLYLQGVAHLGDRVLVRLDLEQLLARGGEVLPAVPTDQGEAPAETLFSGHMDTAAAEAEPLQVGTDLRRLVAFELSGELYGVAVTDVAEICHPLPLTPLPHVPPHVLGLINLRGAVLPLIDMRRLGGLPLKPDGPETRLIVLKGSAYLVALRVDAVHGFVRLPGSSFQPAPSAMTDVASAYYQLATLDERILIELHVPRMLAGTSANPGEDSGTCARSASW